MKGWLPAAAGGALVAVLAIGALVLLQPAPVSPAERTDALARELRCPDCQSLSVADSHTRSAVEIRRRIAELVADGASDAEVRDHFVARYGEWILLAPSGPGYWILPFAVIVAGAGVLVVWLVRRHPGEPMQAPLSADDRRRLHEEADALDA